MKNIYLTMMLVMMALLSFGQDCARYQILNLKDSVSQGHNYVYFQMTIDTALLQNSGYTDLFFVNNTNDTITTHGSWGYYIPDGTNGLDTLNYLLPCRIGVSNFPSDFNGYLMMRNPNCDIPFNILLNGMASFKVDLISVYPNPVHDLLLIEKDIQELKKIEVFDINGKIVLKQEDNLSTINMSLLNSGIYYLAISLSSKEIIYKKIIKN